MNTAQHTLPWLVNKDGTLLDRANGAVIFADGRTLPLHVIFERRNGAYASVRPSGVRIRIPAHLPKREQAKLVAQMEQWVLDNIPAEAPAHLPEYKTGQILRVRDRAYELKISSGKVKRPTGRILPDGILEVRLPPRLKAKGRRDNTATVLSRVIGADFHPEIDRQIRQLLQTWRDLLRRKNGQSVCVKTVRLKNTTSRWGSCSYAGNINLSTRLLLGPKRHMDYVIVHEVAHLVEDNHSRQFWDLVKAMDPNYKESEKWLREEGHTLIW